MGSIDISLPAQAADTLQLLHRAPRRRTGCSMAAWSASRQHLSIDLYHKMYIEDIVV